MGDGARGVSETVADDARVMSQLAIGVVRRGTQVLMVQERLDDSGQLLWSLPGGGVRIGETFAEALVRELAEETGLLGVTPGQVVFVVNSDEPRCRSAIALAFEVQCDAGAELAPADDDICAAEFVPVDEAVRRVGRIGSAIQRDPIVGYLTGESPPGTAWFFRHVDGRDVCLGNTAGLQGWSTAGLQGWSTAGLQGWSTAGLQG